jgi:apolipoprotein N-acyltransferase
MNEPLRDTHPTFVQRGPGRVEEDLALTRVETNRALVKPATNQDKLALGLGGVGFALCLIHPGIIGLAAVIGAVLLTWESVTDREKRSALSLAALGLGTAGLAWSGVGLLTGVLILALRLAIIGAVAAGVYYGGKAMVGKKSPPVDPYAEDTAEGRI